MRHEDDNKKKIFQKKRHFILDDRENDQTSPSISDSQYLVD